MTEPVLECNGLTKRFGGLVAVNNVDLRIDHGDIYGLIGPNGAGKSTLFNMVAGLLKPTEGSITFDGTDVTDYSQYEMCHAGLARTFQTPRPFTSQTAIENVITGLKFGRGTIDRDEATEILEFVGLGEKQNVNAGDLTMVEQKRLDMARALATDPELLLLDEIMAGLNPTEINQFLDLIDRINEDCTVFVIEHIMEAIMRISDTIFVIENGELIAEGTPKQISTNDRVIQAYLGEEYANA